MTQEKLQIRLKGLFKCFSELDILLTQKCDKAMLKFKSFVGDIKNKCQAELQSLTCKVWLEKFYFDEISIQKYGEIAEVLKIVLILSHGQASVEHVFNHIDTVVQTNMSVASVISKSLIKDHMLFYKLKPYFIKITDPMIRAFKSSHLEYQLHLESEKK